MFLMVARFLVSLCGVGRLPGAPATWGSAASCIILYFLYPSLSLSLKITLLAAVFLCGLLLCRRVLRSTVLHDPSFIVIDEAVGMMIVTLFLSPVWWQFLLAFLLFRFFDILKMWPASVVDRWEGSLAIMLDDVLMAIPSLLSLHIILSWLLP